MSESGFDKVESILKGIAIGVCVLGAITFFLGMIISSGLDDLSPTEAVKTECFEGNTAHVPGDQWNAAYVKGIFDYCERLHTVTAAKRGFRIAAIIVVGSVAMVVAWAFFSVFNTELIETHLKSKKQDKNGAIKKPKHKPIKFSKEEVDVILTIIENNTNRNLRYDAFVKNPNFAERNMTKGAFFEKIEKIVRGYITFDGGFTKNNRAAAIDEIQYFLEKGEVDFFSLFLLVEPGEVIEKLKNNKKKEAYYFKDIR